MFYHHQKVRFILTQMFLRSKGFFVETISVHNGPRRTKKKDLPRDLFFGQEAAIFAAGNNFFFCLWSDLEAERMVCVYQDLCIRHEMCRDGKWFRFARWSYKYSGISGLFLNVVSVRLLFKVLTCLVFIIFIDSIHICILISYLVSTKLLINIW